MVGPRGFEPRTSGSEGVSNNDYFKQIDCKDDYSSLLNDFSNFLRIDRQLCDGTIYRHRYEINRLMIFYKSDPRFLQRKDVRNYLLKFNNRPANTYANVLKSLKVFYRDYLGMGNIVESFKFPNRPTKIVKVPPKEDLQEFYDELDTVLAKKLFLLYATSGLRRNEVLNLRYCDVDFNRRMITPLMKQSRTKHTWITFYNKEAEMVLNEHINTGEKDEKRKLFPVTETYFRKRCLKIEKRKGIKITPQVLREWFCSEMGSLGAPDRYVDAFCGRTPKSVLARHYTDYSPRKLKEIYEKAGLKVLFDEL